MKVYKLEWEQYDDQRYRRNEGQQHIRARSLQEALKRGEVLARKHPDTLKSQPIEWVSVSRVTADLR